MHLGSAPGLPAGKYAETRRWQDGGKAGWSAAWRPYMGVAFSVVLLTVLLRLFNLSFDLVNNALLFLLPVLFSAAYWGKGPSIFAACLGVLAFDFFFVPPVISFTVADLRYLVSFGVYLAVALLTASLAARLRQQLLSSKQREAGTAALYAISRQMTAITDLNDLYGSVIRQVSATVASQVAVFVPDGKGTLAPCDGISLSDWTRDGAEWETAVWAFQRGETAGRGTRTFGEARGLYVPLRTGEESYGVLAVNLENRAADAVQEDRRFLEALGSLAASAAARVKWSEEAKLAQLTAESEKLRTALLDSVSHELRTPLATIIGSVTALAEGERIFSSEDRLDLLSTVRDGALRMNRLVTNLLGMAKLESGMLQLRKKWCDIEDIVGVVLAQVKDFQQQRDIQVRLPEGLPLLRGDDVLLEQVLANLVSNAIKYSADHSAILISAREEDGRMILSVADSGMGIREEDRPYIFGKFYRSDAARPMTGTGLGLAISKGIIELHGGSIAAEPHAGGGTVMIITLPIEDQPDQDRGDQGEREGGLERHDSGNGGQDSGHR